MRNMRPLQELCLGYYYYESVISYSNVVSHLKKAGHHATLVIPFTYRDDMLCNALLS